MDTNKSDLKYVGKSYIREDVYDKASGKTKYTCDRQIAGMLYAKLVLSEKSHADITTVRRRQNRYRASGQCLPMRMCRKYLTTRTTGLPVWMLPWTSIF